MSRRTNSGSAKRASANFDLHERVQMPREPQSVAGRIDRIAIARHPLSKPNSTRRAEDNERNSLVIYNRNGSRRDPDCRLVAGGSYSPPPLVRECQSIGDGERFGLIRLRMRLDDLLIRRHQIAGIGGQTGWQRKTILGIQARRTRPELIARLTLVSLPCGERSNRQQA